LSGGGCGEIMVDQQNGKYRETAYSSWPDPEQHPAAAAAQHLHLNESCKSTAMIQSLISWKVQIGG
jgi:hypothetical protein